MFNVKITNTTQDVYKLAYSFGGRRMGMIEIGDYALNQEVVFGSEEIFESFVNQHKDIFDKGYLVHTHKFSEKQAEKINEQNENEEFKKSLEAQIEDLKATLQGIAGRVEVAIENRSNGDKVAEIVVEGNGSQQKGNKK